MRRANEDIPKQTTLRINSHNRNNCVTVADVLAKEIKDSIRTTETNKSAVDTCPSRTIFGISCFPYEQITKFKTTGPSNRECALRILVVVLKKHPVRIAVFIETAVTTC